MDFEPFHKGVYLLVASLATSLVTALQIEIPQQQLAPLKSPVSIEHAISQTSTDTSFEYIQKYEDLNNIAVLEEQSKVNQVETDSQSSLVIEKTIPIVAESIISIPDTEVKLVLATPTTTPTPTPIPTPIPTVIPSPVQTQAPQATAEATLKPQALENHSDIPSLQLPAAPSVKTANSLSSDILLQMINQYRESKNLPKLEKDPQLCQLAAFRGPELHEEIYGSKKVHQGLYELNLPYWITENMASYGSEKQIFNWWMNSKIHRAAIEGNYKYSCGVCSGNSCAQLFTNYTAK